MKSRHPGTFAAHLKSLREAAGFTQEELATIAGLSVHAVSALERGERRRPQLDTVRALSTALDLHSATRDALLASARGPAQNAAVEELSGDSLPLALTALIGRDGDVETLRHWLADQTVRLITLTGREAPGRPVWRWSSRVSSQLKAQPEWYSCRLAAIQNPAFVASAIAEALGLSDATGLGLLKRARIACDGHPVLLVLDNFEHVLEAGRLVAELLVSIASLRVLATSRAPLRIRGEREYPVGPLGMGLDTDATLPADLARAPAVRLFVERVRDAQPAFQLTPSNRLTVMAICQRLDALPLALELAAPWLKVLTPEDLLRRLTEDVLLPAAGPRDLPERQQTMNATVAWSYQLLAANGQRAFRHLGVLPGRFPIEAAAAVLGQADSPAATGETLTAAAGLIEKSLLLRADSSRAGRPLYQMLETVRAFAVIELEAAGERDDALSRLADYCTGEAAVAAAGLVSAGQAEWLDRVRDELESYRCALTWLIERARPVEACDIAWRLMFFWAIRGHAAEGVDWYQQILSLPNLPPITESTALVGAGAMWYTRGELGRARIGLTRGLTLAETAGDPSMIAQAENLLGHVELALGNLDAAGEWFTRSADAFRALSTAWGTGNSLSGAAWVALAKQDISRAERLLDEADSVLRDGGPWFLSLALYVRGIMAVRRGHADQAIALTRESLSHIRELHDTFAFVYALVPLTAAAILKQDDEWAARILGVRDAVTERTGATVVDTSVHDLTDQAERELRLRLGPERWARAYAEGRRSSIDALMEDIDRVSEAAPPSRVPRA